MDEMTRLLQASTARDVRYCSLCGAQIKGDGAWGHDDNCVGAESVGVARPGLIEIIELVWQDIHQHGGDESCCDIRRRLMAFLVGAAGEDQT